MNISYVLKLSIDLPTCLLKGIKLLTNQMNIFQVVSTWYKYYSKKNHNQSANYFQKQLELLYSQLRVMASIDFSKSSHQAVPYILPLSLLVIKLFKIYCDRFTHLCRIYVHSDFINSMSFLGLIFYLISCIHIWINYFHPINIFCNLFKSSKYRFMSKGQQLFY